MDTNDKKSLVVDPQKNGLKQKFGGEEKNILGMALQVRAVFF